MDAIKARPLPIVVAGSALAVMLAAYAAVAVFRQPVPQGSEELMVTVPGQAWTMDPDTLAKLSSGEEQTPREVLEYADRSRDFLVKSVYNSGAVPLTINGIETTGNFEGWAGLVTVQNPRPAIINGPAPCCDVDVAKTWRAGEFRPINVDPGKYGVVAVQLFMNNCESNGPGGYMIIDTIKVHYSVLGFPHSDDVEVGPYWFHAPDTCPRTGPARP